MSNATDSSRQSGDRRRRRSRGGKNRNRNNNSNQQGQGRNPNHGNRSGEARSPRVRRTRQAAKLSWWQKLLKAIGLYKEAAPKKERKIREDREETQQSPKSNTRNARGKSPNPEFGESKESSESRGQGKRRRGGDPSTVGSNRVYVGNLSYDVTEQDLQELFKGVGTVRNVEIVYNRSTHRSKGYGFVEMLRQDDAVRCVEVLNDQPFMGRNMIVSGAKSKQEEDEDTGPEINVANITLAPLPTQAVSEAATEASEAISSEATVASQEPDADQGNTEEPSSPVQS